MGFRKCQSFVFALAWLMFLSVTSHAMAQTELSTIGRVNRALPSMSGPIYQKGSDAASLDFQTNVLPALNQAVQSTIGERVSFANASALAVDPSSLIIKNPSDVRVYFVSEGAGYHNSLAFATGSEGVNDASALTIFNDASSSITSLSNNAYENRSYSAPLLPGDFVDLGTMETGTVLDFFLLANGAYSGTRNPWYTSADRNADGVDHVITLAVENSPYLVLGFEDLFNGGDRDFNDLVIAVDIGHANVARIIGTPEPPLPLLALLFVALIVWPSRKSDSPAIKRRN